MALNERSELLIGGKWQAPTSDTKQTFVHPATGKYSGSVRLASPEDMDNAITKARESFDNGEWSTASPSIRAAALEAAANYLESRVDDLTELVTTEVGCPIWFSEKSHVASPIRHLRYYAKLAREYPYDEVRSDGIANSLVTREPVGVVGAITPWNGPLSSPTLKLAPALAAGCSVVLKVSREAPRSALALADAFYAAGLPDGVLSVLPADRTVGQQLVDHPSVDKIAFTGSTSAGIHIASAAAQTVKRVTLELGGKSAAIILDDADLESTVAKLLPMAMLVNGQACIAQTRVLVPRSRYVEVVDALADSLSSLSVGNPHDRETEVGPMISERQRDRVAEYISLGQREGARLVTGGAVSRDNKALSDGWFIPPTLFAEVNNGMKIAQEEIFGPVIAAIPYDTEDEAVAIANNSPYGLSGSVWSADESRGLSIARRIRTGMVSLNGSPQAYGSPFGGYKQSGIGREMGPEGFEAYHEIKSIAGVSK